MKKWIWLSLCVLLPFAIFGKTSSPTCLGLNDDRFPEGDGSSLSPYLICNESQFRRLSDESELLDKHFKLGSDIRFTNSLYKIGTHSYPYTGHFDGNHYTLSAIKIVRKGDELISNMGLFASIQNAQISNLMINDLNIPDAGIYVGGLAGSSINSVIFNVHIKNITMNAPDYSGGLIGEANNSTLFNCSTQGKLNNHFGTDGSGGLIGIAFRTSIKHSFSKIIINNKSENPFGVSAIGGLVGDMIFGEMEDVYAIGSIEYTSRRDGPKGVGGLIGYASSTKVDKAYAAVRLNITAVHKGGAIGFKGVSLLNNVYWDYEVAGIHFGDGGEPLDTTTMQTPDFWLNQAFDPSQWILVKGQYPTLRTQCTFLPNNKIRHC